MKTPKTIADWSGLGTLYEGEDPCAQIEYGLHVWCQDQPIRTATGAEESGLYASSGSFKTVGFEPDIQKGATLILQPKDGKQIEVLILSYDWGQGTFQLTEKAVQDLFGNS